MRYTLHRHGRWRLFYDCGWICYAIWTRQNSRAPQPRFTLARPAARPRPSSYARLVMHLRDTGQTGGVIQTPRGEMRWGDQCEPWVDPFEGRCCCGKEEPCPPGAPWPDEPCRPEAGDCCDGSAHMWQPAQGSRLPDCGPAAAPVGDQGAGRVEMRRKEDHG